MANIAIFGASGAALEVADVCYALGYERIVLLEKGKTKSFKKNNLDVLSECHWQELDESGFSFAIGISAPEVREKVALRYKKLEFPNLIHPQSNLGMGQLEKFYPKKGNVVAAGAAFMSNIQVGDFGFYSLNCTIGHDCIMGDFVSVMPGVNVSGNVRISMRTYLGTGSVILQGSDECKLVIGEAAVVGAGAVVTKPVLANSTVIGVPARDLKSE